MLKIIGLFAFWKSVQTFTVMISGFGIFSSVLKNSGMDKSFFISIGLSMILSFILPLIVAILFVFKTERVLSFMKIKNNDNIELNLNLSRFYHIIVLVFGILVLINGASNFLSVDYKTETKTEFSTGSVNTNKTIINDTKNTTINYFALLELIFGAVLLLKATSISKFLESKFEDKNRDDVNLETN